MDPRGSGAAGRVNRRACGITRTCVKSQPVLANPRSLRTILHVQTCVSLDLPHKPRVSTMAARLHWAVTRGRQEGLNSSRDKGRPDAPDYCEPDDRGRAFG